MKKAEKTATKWLEAWQKENWQEMYNLCQKSWQSRNSREKLRDTFGSVLPQIFEIVGSEKISRSITDVFVMIKFQNGSIGEGRIRLLHEGAPYMPTPARMLFAKGSWGVNPISAMSLFARKKY